MLHLRVIVPPQLTDGVGSLWIGRRLSRRRAIAELRGRRAARSRIRTLG